MKLHVDMIKGEATAEFEEYPKAIIESNKTYISEYQVDIYRKQGYKIYWDSGAFRHPWVIINKVMGYQWGEYMAESDRLWNEIKACKSRNITVVNKKEFLKVRNKVKKDYNSLVKEQDEKKRHEAIMHLLSKQDSATLVTLIETAYWGLFDHYVINGNSLNDASEAEQNVLNLKDKLYRYLGGA